MFHSKGLKSAPKGGFKRLKLPKNLPLEQQILGPFSENLEGLKSSPKGGLKRLKLPKNLPLEGADFRPFQLKFSLQGNTLKGLKLPKNCP